LNEHELKFDKVNSRDDGEAAWEKV
jgi:hypothetical protein